MCVLVRIHVCTHRQEPIIVPPVPCHGAWERAGEGLVLETRSDVFDLRVLPGRHLVET